MLRSFQSLLSLPVVAGTMSCQFHANEKYVSQDWPGYREKLSELRSVFGTINGPLPVQPNVPPYFNYNVEGYKQSFKKAGISWVRFQDLSLSHGGTSLSQIFTAWPLSDSDLAKADVDRLAGNPSNYHFEVLDQNVKAALAAGARIDFRLGDSHQVCEALAGGEPLPVGDLSRSATFPKAWMFPTNMKESKGVDLWVSVALHVAEHVWELVGKDRNKVVFDLFTETTSDGSPFWPFTPELYADVYSRVMTQIKYRFGENVICVGANTMNPMGTPKGGGETFMERFLKACAKLGQKKCPLDVVAFHAFGDGDGIISKYAKWVQDQMEEHLKGFNPLPHLAMTAWGFHGSGMFPYNDEGAGAARMANAIIETQNTPLDFTIYYKWAGVNCNNLGSPCLVVNEPGTLKAPAVPVQLFSEMQSMATKRVVASCGTGANVVAALSNNGKSLVALLAPTSRDGDDTSPAKLQFLDLPCAGHGAMLNFKFLANATNTDHSAVTRTVSVSGRTKNSIFYETGSGKPYEMPAYYSSYALLLELSCRSLTAAEDVILV